MHFFKAKEGFWAGDGLILQGFLFFPIYPGSNSVRPPHHPTPPHRLQLTEYPMPSGLRSVGLNHNLCCIFSPRLFQRVSLKGDWPGDLGWWGEGGLLGGWKESVTLPGAKCALYIRVWHEAFLPPPKVCPGYSLLGELWNFSAHRESLAFLADIALEVKQVVSKLSPDV